MKQLFLVDNSVLRRVHGSAEVADALTALLDEGDLAGCLPQVLVEGRSAQDAREHGILMAANLRAKLLLAPDVRVAELAIDLQRRLFEVGIGHAVGVNALQIAATAIRHANPEQRVVVVHHDASFESVARVAPEFSHRWILPPGALT